MAAETAMPYGRDELYKVGGPREFSGAGLGEVAFPLGGIGTGTVALGGRGHLRDWEIFNRPSKGLTVPQATLLRVQAPGQPARVRVLEGRIQPPHYNGAFGRDTYVMAGLPRMAECSFSGAYPLAKVALSDPALPVAVTLEAFTPFAPMNDHDSGLPVAIFLYTLTNTGEVPLDLTLVASLLNPVGYDAAGPLPDHGLIARRTPVFGGNLNEWASEGGVTGLRLGNPNVPADDPRFGTLTLATPWPDVTFALRWPGTAWFDDLQTFWDGLVASPTLADDPEARPSPEGWTDMASLGLRVPRLEPGATVRLPIVLAWHFPNLINYWDRGTGPLGGQNPAVQGRRLGNYYTTLFPDAFAAARYAAAELERLEAETRAYHDTLMGSTLPAYVLDAVSSQASIIRTTTCLRTEDGEFHAFEGCNDSAGCCPMNCTHVWNYEHSLAYLFPALERSMRRTDFRVNVRPTGNMAFRTILPLGAGMWEFKPAADGQMGCSLKLYREWQIGGDLEFVRGLWPQATRALEFAWTNGWDPDKDGVMEGEQHNTYDIEFYGPNTMCGAFYLGALAAMAEMADALGEGAKASEYRALLARGRAGYDSQLWNGDYYEQRVEAPQGGAEAVGLAWHEPAVDASGDVKYQYGPGCLADMLLGQWFADVVGLGDLLPGEHVQAGLAAIYRYNWRPDFSDHACCQRTYALNDEAGLLLCTWPRGGRPALPFPYADEVWTGVEYQVASHLIYRGMVDEGLTIVKGLRDRYDGQRRNPWNEVECGNHYARAMASWALLLALTGYHYSAPRQSLRLAPLLNAADFAAFFSAGESWGRFTQRAAGGALHWGIELLGGGDLTVSTLRLRYPGLTAGTVRAEAAGAPVDALADADGDDLVVGLAAPVTVKRGQALRLTLPLAGKA